MAAAVSLPRSLRSKIRPTQEPSYRNFLRASFGTAVRCQNHEPDDPEKSTMKNDKGSPSPAPRILGGLEKLGNGLRDSLSPQRKGDWKDLTLMSLSFAVYVYMSQKIVCAYYAWTSMPKPPW
ncbi:hypothetical protein CRG98_045676 [Punica granatum]|uniref:Uncharacterized protein n=1 Tax=Punica granatum TaxID=22663 RepID=A0A2I0HQE7_PUNGR|nr:hypothetical protein CRG98_045676 [Punica granatum]